MDYSTKIDAQTWAFIEETGKYYPPDAVTLTVAEQRDVYDRMCRAFHRGYPDGIAVSDLDAGGVPCRLYVPSQASDITVLYIHGGGFVVGGLESHDDVCAEICDRTGYRVLSADYRMSPEHDHPAAFEDCWDVLLYALGAWDSPVVLAGDSAGGNLAAAVAHHARGRAMGVIGQVLIYPGLGGDMTNGSYIEHAQAPLLTMEEIEFYKTIRTSGRPAPEGDPTYAPLQDTDFKGLPPTVCICAECDPLADDGAAYRDAILKAGGQATFIREDGLVHGYLRARRSVKRAADSFDRIIDAISALGREDWPY